jgi:uncharacterized protein YneF (UPF0154 family)
MGYILGAVIVGAAIVLFGIYVIAPLMNKQNNDNPPPSSN